MFLTIAFWLFFCYLVGKFAEKKGRSFWAFAIISGIASPIVGFIVALIAGQKADVQQSSQYYYNSQQSNHQYYHSQPNQQHFTTGPNENYSTQPYNPSSMNNTQTRLGGAPSIFCSECGAQIPSSSKICPKCGNILPD